jgi:hypothetical protein
VNINTWAVAALLLAAATPAAKATGATNANADTAMDSQAAASADGMQTVFVRTVPGASPGSELWWSKGDGTAPRRLLQERADSDLKRSLVGFNNPVFAANGRSVYVMTQAWATSNAIHRIDLQTGRVNFVADGNSVQVVPAGRWAGHLVVMKHKYVTGGGALDHYWLLTPSGHEVRKVGRSDAEVAAFLAKAMATQRP